MRSLLVLATLVATAPTCAVDHEDAAEVRARVEERVKADLARRQDAKAEAIGVVEFAERTWPDGRLGCAGRRMAGDPVPVPGFRVVLSLAERRYVYHADREGRFVPCDRPPKPIDRIQ
jgi:hypothetical protein